MNYTYFLIFVLFKYYSQNFEFHVYYIISYVVHLLFLYFISYKRRGKRKSSKRVLWTFLIEWVILMGLLLLKISIDQGPLPFNLLLQILVLTWLWRLSQRQAGMPHKKIKIRLISVRPLRVSVLSLSLVCMQRYSNKVTHMSFRINIIRKSSTKYSNLQSRDVEDITNWMIKYIDFTNFII